MTIARVSPTLHSIYVPRPTAFAILVRTYILKQSAMKAKLVTLRATAAMVGPLFGVPSGVLYAHAIALSASRAQVDVLQEGGTRREDAQSKWMGE
jgi:hypothetical protein